MKGLMITSMKGLIFCLLFTGCVLLEVRQQERVRKPVVISMLSFELFSKDVQFV